MSKVPTRDAILEWISDNPTQTSKRDIARAFGIKGADRVELKSVLRGLEEDGHLERRRKTYRDPERLPPVSVLKVVRISAEGEPLAEALEWQGEGPSPMVLLLPRASDPALGIGDRVLARVTLVSDETHAYEGRLIRRIGQTRRKLLGVYRVSSEGGRVVPIEKGSDREWQVSKRDSAGARDGELVEAEQSGPKGRLGLPRARVIERLGDPSAPKSVSLIAIHHHQIPYDFPKDALDEADAATEATLGDRLDLRDKPFVTIDPADARDHDDACWAHADDDPKNARGHVIWVAIADVALYVTPGSTVDKEALNRGNSTYFADRVVPMLPDRLSGDLCSLHEGLDRPCLAVRMQITEDGQMIGRAFHRALIKSHASLVYEEVQAARDGQPNTRCASLHTTVIQPLYAAYDALNKARRKRQPLDLDLPERRIEIDEGGQVRSVNLKDRLDAHRLIEEFMVLANVAAAETLEEKQAPFLYRVHENPSPEKLDALREVAEAAGLSLAKGQVLKTSHLNRLLQQAEGTDSDELINLSTLRAMTQAYYTPEHIGHFGLALRSYAHFTSPIRRYADLVVHRALIAAHGFVDDGIGAEDPGYLEHVGRHISDTERRSMAAERDTNDRYLASYLSERVGSEMTGRISNVARFGAFVTLDGTGADGLIPIRTIGREFFHYDKRTQTLLGADTGIEISSGQRVTVRLSQTVPVTGGLTLELLALEDRALPVPKRATRGKSRKGRVTRRRR
ncbi:MAG: ribonuclease R [Pseudomonadota bacterium]